MNPKVVVPLAHRRSSARAVRYATAAVRSRFISRMFSILVARGDPAPLRDGLAATGVGTTGAPQARADRSSR